MLDEIVQRLFRLVLCYRPVEVLEATRVISKLAVYDADYIARY